LQVRKKASENCGEGLLEASVSMPTRRRFHRPSGGPGRPGSPATPLQLAAATPGSRCGQARFDHERVAAIPRRRCANRLALFVLSIAQSVGPDTRFVHGFPISSLFGAGVLGKAGRGIASDEPVSKTAKIQRSQKSRDP
jgi:hypothetical protein